MPCTTELLSRPYEDIKSYSTESYRAAVTNRGVLRISDEKDASTYAEPNESYVYASIAPKSRKAKTATFDPKIPVTIPVTLNKLGSYVRKCHSNANDAFIQQFKV